MNATSKNIKPITKADQMLDEFLRASRRTEDDSKATVDGKVWMCAIHGLDYRIACEECQEKYAGFNKLVIKLMLREQKERDI